MTKHALICRASIVYIGEKHITKLQEPHEWAELDDNGIADVGHLMIHWDIINGKLVKVVRDE